LYRFDFRYKWPSGTGIDVHFSTSVEILEGGEEEKGLLLILCDVLHALEGDKT
jgi:hypothetical protein